MQILDWPIVRKLRRQRYVFLSLMLFLLTGQLYVAIHDCVYTVFAITNECVGRYLAEAR